MYESSDSQFLRITTGIQSEPDAFDEWRFIMTFLTILGAMEILCSFRLVLEGKTGKEIPESSRLEFLETFFTNDFALSDAEDNTTCSLIYLCWEYNLQFAKCPEGQVSGKWSTLLF